MSSGAIGCLCSVEQLAAKRSPKLTLLALFPDGGTGRLQNAVAEE